MHWAGPTHSSWPAIQIGGGTGTGIGSEDSARRKASDIPNVEFIAIVVGARQAIDGVHTCFGRVRPSGAH